MDRPGNWEATVDAAMKPADLATLRLSVVRGRPFGGEAWVLRMAKKLMLEYTLRRRGRPSKVNAKMRIESKKG